MWEVREVWREGGIMLEWVDCWWNNLVLVIGYRQRDSELESI